MDNFERIIVKQNKYTIDTVCRDDFIKWTGFHNIYTAPPNINTMPSFKRQKTELYEMIELYDILS